MAGSGTNAPPGGAERAGSRASAGSRTACARPATGTCWGPYVSERQWGTVREDYSADGDAWDYFPHDHARSRAYRWGEDGLAGFCDDRAAPLPRRSRCGTAATRSSRSGCSGSPAPQGNHGEDAKEYWWYLDAMPSHAWNRWRYHYPQARVPVRAT